MTRRLKILILAFFCFSSLLPPAAHAAANSQALIMRGTARTLAAAFEIPKTMLQHSQHLAFPVALVSGAVVGTFRTLFGTLGGALDIAEGAAPYAKYAALA